MIKPTIGRVVWFWPSENFIAVRGHSTPAFVFDGNGPCAAIIVKVIDDHIVNLAAFDQQGTNHPVVNCPLRQEGERVTEGASYCEWMPYQIGQAKRDSSAPIASNGLYKQDAATQGSMAI